MAQWKHISSRNLQCFSVENTGAGSACADSHLPSACICIHFNAHIEGEHVFNGNHSEMNYTDSVRDLMIYVHNTLKQMIGTGHSRWRWQKNAESVRFPLLWRTDISAHTHTPTPPRDVASLGLLVQNTALRPGKGRLCLEARHCHTSGGFELIRVVCLWHNLVAWRAVINT